MGGVWLCVLLVGAVADFQDSDVGLVLGQNNHVDKIEEELKGTDLVLAFVVRLIYGYSNSIVTLSRFIFVQSASFTVY